MMDPDQQLRNLRDFLLVYNRMTEICFQRCTSNFNYRNLTMDEDRCVDNCAGKLIRSNHRLMGTYVQLMPKMMQRRMEEIESKAAENAKAAEAAASANALPPVEETTAAPQTLVASAPSSLLAPPLTDVRPEAHSSVLSPAALDTPVGLNTTLPTTTEVKLSAATPLTPAAEALSLPVLSDAGNGPSHTAGFTQLPIAGVQIEPGSLPVSMSSNQSSIPVDVPVSTLAAPTVSLPTESLHQERAPDVPPQSSQ